jgi:hypothetical protein
MLQNKIEGAKDLLNLIACRRRKEIDLEKKESSEPENTETSKAEKIVVPPKIEEFKNMLHIEVIQNPKSVKESNKYVLVATLQHEEIVDQERGDDEEISVKAFKQKYDDKREKEPPWTSSSREASKRAKEELEKAKSAPKDKPREQMYTTRRSDTRVPWEPEEKRPLRNEAKEDSSSSSEDSSDDKEEIDAPEGGKEIKTEPPSKGRSLSPERPSQAESSWKLQPWRREKTMTTEKRTVPIKKDPIKEMKKSSDSITRLTKEDLKKSTEDLAKIRSERRFIPVWMRRIPMTIEDFKHKEGTWQGFHMALEHIGLDPREVEKRLREGKTPWTDLEETQRCCQKAFMEHQMKIPKLPQTTQAKSKVTKPDVERRSVSLRASSSKQVKESEDSEVEFWDERETRPKGDRVGKRPRTKIYKNSPTRSEKKTKIKRSRSRQTRKESPESVKYECDDECKIQVETSKGKLKECG